MKASIEVLRRVYDDNEGVFIEVSPDADNPDWLRIGPEGQKSKEYYGDFSLSITKQQARLLGLALIAACDEIQLTEPA